MFEVGVDNEDGGFMGFSIEGHVTEGEDGFSGVFIGRAMGEAEGGILGAVEHNVVDIFVCSGAKGAAAGLEGIIGEVFKS